MSSPIKISQLATITSVTPDDMFIVNDGNVNTRKVNFTDLTATLVKTTGDQVINGSLTVTGNLTTTDFTIGSDLVSVDTTFGRVGVMAPNPGFTLDVGGPINIRNGNMLRLADADSSHAVSLQSAAVLPQNTPYTLPGAYPTANYQVLGSTTSGAMSWVEALVDPLLATGDLLYRANTGQSSRLPIGGFGQVLTVGGDGLPGWNSNPAGFADPLTTPGDLIVRLPNNATSRFPIGGNGQVLTVSSSEDTLIWQFPVAGAGGSTNGVQWNNNGVLAATSDFTYDSITNTVFIENLAITGETEFLSDVVIGDTAVDQLNIKSVLISDLVPNVSDAFNLGAIGKHWQNLYLSGEVSVTDGGSSGSYFFDDLSGYTFTAYGPAGSPRPTRLTLKDELNNNTIGIDAPLASTMTGGSYLLSLPGVQGKQGSALTNDGSGNLTWSLPGVHASWDASSGAGFSWASNKIDSNGVASVTRTDVGKFTINFTSSFVSNKYTAVCSAGGTDGIAVANHTVAVISRTSSTLDIVVEDASDGTNVDSEYIAIIVMGGLN